MIGRRGFITGLGCLVAAPAIARPDAISAFFDSDLRDRMFDLRGGPALFIRCFLTCCSFLLDETSAQVTIQACTMASCRIDGMVQFTRKGNMFRDNYVEDSFLDWLPTSPGPTNVGDNVIIGAKLQLPPQCAAPVS
jgi:hypothetical protein